MRVLPIVMVRNEELWIEQVLRPLAAVFPKVLLGDTGSTDRTLEIAGRVRGVEVIEYGPQTPQELGQVRYRMAQHGLRQGFEYAFLVDGDQLYSETALRWVVEQEWPGEAPTPGPSPVVTGEGKRFLGFVTMVSLDQDQDGQLWEMADLFNYPPIYPLTEKWSGAYPYEVPEAFNDSRLYHYFEAPPGYRYHAVHLHRLARSSQDAAVFLRVQKQKRFSLMERRVPRTVRFDMKEWTRRQGNDEH